MNKQQILKSLKKAENFISGFEDDESQRGVKSMLREIRKSIKAMEDVEQHPIGILRIDERDALSSFVRKIENNQMAEYIDVHENLAEDLYSCEIRERLKAKGVKLTPTENAFLTDMERLMAEKDCSYFRIESF